MSPMTETAKRTLYVATCVHTEQVGFDQSQTFHETMICNPSDTIDKVLLWASTWNKSNPEVSLTMGFDHRDASPTP